MKLDEISLRFPSLTRTLGKTWLTQNHNWVEDYISTRSELYDLLEVDLRRLGQLLGLHSLTRCYRDLLRDRETIWTTFHEIHGVSLLGEISTSLELKVPRGDSSKKDFDARACIEGTIVNAECKTRKNEFPFNVPRTVEGPERIPVHSGSRATLDPHDAADFGIPFEFRENDVSYKPIPESTEVRRTLSSGLDQLPNSGCNLILFGQFTGSCSDLEDAIFGSPMVYFQTNAITMRSECFRTRVQTGAFCSGPVGEPFRQLSAVLWFRLLSVFGPEYRLFLNPTARCPLPDDTVVSLEAVISRRTMS